MIKLFSDIKGLLPYILVVFLNAIIDLGDKILLQNAIFKFYDGDTQIILTAFVNALIIIPGILLFTPAGYISDKFSKSIEIQQQFINKNLSNQMHKITPFQVMKKIEEFK